jgi:oxygen-dependent protoporphyrinogen oxidase
VDAVCSSMPSDQLSRILREEPLGIAKKLDKVTHHSAATLNMAYAEEDMTDRFFGSGFVVPASEGRSLTACTFSSQKFKGRSPKGRVLLRAFVGGAFGKKYFDMEDKELAERVHGDLVDLMGVKNKPIFCSLARYPRRMAQYHVGHQVLISEIEADLGCYEGLFLTGCAYRGSGIPNAIQDGQVQAERIFGRLKHRN